MSEARKILRFRLLPDRPRYPLDGEIVPVGMERYQTHQGHRVGVMGIHRESLLATKLGIEMCAGPQMAKAGFIKHCRFAEALGARFRGFSGAFARDHWRISPQPAETVSDSFVIRKLGTHRRRSKEPEKGGSTRSCYSICLQGRGGVSITAVSRPQGGGGRRRREVPRGRGLIVLSPFCASHSTQVCSSRHGP